MMIKKFGIALIVALLVSQALFAQQKRPLTHEDYDGWERLASEKITKDGKWMGYQISPQDGDGRIEFSLPNNLKKVGLF